MSHIVTISVTIILILLNAFFVISEFSLLRIRKTRLSEMFEGNNWGSDELKKILTNLNYYIISSQIGITLSTLTIGYFTQGYIVNILTSLFNIAGNIYLEILSFFIALFLVSFFYSVISEIAPKMVVIQEVETWALRVAPPLYYIGYILYPFTILYRNAAMLFLSLLNIENEGEVYSRVYSEDELKVIVAQSHQKGEIDGSEEVLINRVLDFTDTRVNEIFTPRYDIVAFEIDTPIDEIIEQAKITGHSRFPVYEGKLDQVVGFVHVKDILISDHDDFHLQDVMRSVFTIHEAMRLDMLLQRMQQDQIQMAIVVDEYGSVEGIVTIEDILEAIVGPIDDEFDINSVDLVKKISKNKYDVDGRITLDIFNQAFQTQLESEDAVTIAGYILEHLKSIPEEGAKLQLNSSIEFEVKKMEGNRVDKAQINVKKNKKTEIKGIQEPIPDKNGELDRISDASSTDQ